MIVAEFECVPASQDVARWAWMADSLESLLRDQKSLRAPKVGGGGRSHSHWLTDWLAFPGQSLTVVSMNQFHRFCFGGHCWTSSAVIEYIMDTVSWTHCCVPNYHFCDRCSWFTGVGDNGSLRKHTAPILLLPQMQRFSFWAPVCDLFWEPLEETHEWACLERKNARKSTESQISSCCGYMR